MGEDAPAGFVEAVARRAARLVATWTAAGFVHGVLNSDNLNVSGESFEYGPYRFLPVFDPSFTAAYFDQTGLYAFGQQPRAVAFGLTRLADALRLLAPTAQFAPAVRAFELELRDALPRGYLARLGLRSADPDLDASLASAVEAFLEESRMPFERFFFDWYGGAASDARARGGKGAEFYTCERFRALRDLFELFSPSRPEALAHPYFQGEEPCTLLYDEIESLWASIDADDDWGPFDAKIESIRRMGEALRASSSSGGD